MRHIATVTSGRHFSCAFFFQFMMIKTVQRLSTGIYEQFSFRLICGTPLYSNFSLSIYRLRRSNMDNVLNKDSVGYHKIIPAQKIVTPSKPLTALAMPFSTEVSWVTISIIILLL